MSSVILCNLSDANEIVQEERTYWTISVLDYLGIPEEVYDATTVDEFRERMDTYGVEVELSTGGEIKIYKKEWYEGAEDSGWLPLTEDHLIAHWQEPNRIVNTSRNETYYEIHLNEWSILNMRRKI